MSSINITTLETRFMQLMTADSFYEDNEYSVLWSEIFFAETVHRNDVQMFKGVLGSLVKKEVLDVYYDAEARMHVISILNKEVFLQAINKDNDSNNNSNKEEEEMKTTEQTSTVSQSEERRLAKRRVRSSLRKTARETAISEGLRGCALVSRARKLYKDWLHTSLDIRTYAVDSHYA